MRFMKSFTICLIVRSFSCPEGADGQLCCRTQLPMASRYERSQRWLFGSVSGRNHAQRIQIILYLLRSVKLSFSQRNGKQCGRCGLLTRVDFDKPHMQVSILPGRGTDDDTDFTVGVWMNSETVSDSFRSLTALADRLLTEQLILPVTMWLKKRNITFPR